MRHINELMIGGIQDMRYYTTACDLQAANDLRNDLLASDLCVSGCLHRYNLWAYEYMTHDLTFALPQKKKTVRQGENCETHMGQL